MFIGVLGNSGSSYFSSKPELNYMEWKIFTVSLFWQKNISVSTKHPEDKQYMLEFSEAEEGIGLILTS